MRVDFHQGFLNNMLMALAFYHIHHLTSSTREEISEILTVDLNLEHPVAFDLKKLSLVDQEIAMNEIESFFRIENQSVKFPYPVYVITDLEDKFSIVTLRTREELPKFYSKRSSKMNVKETHLSEKNTLLQREVKNTDTFHYSRVLKDFSEAHRTIFDRERERFFYEDILERLSKRLPSDK